MSFTNLLANRFRSKRRCFIVILVALSLWITLNLQDTTSSSSSTLGYAAARGKDIISMSSLSWMKVGRRPSVYSQMLDHKNEPLCPRHLAKYDRQKLMLLEAVECQPVESKMQEFSVEVCFSTFTCNEGLVKIRRKDRTTCKALLNTPTLSQNLSHDAFHRQFSGPDSFHVLFSGAEKLSPPDWYHAGHCVYVFPFHISNPGRFSLDIMHLYEKYEAVSEVLESWPDLNRKMVVENLGLDICRGCETRTAEPRFLTQEDQLGSGLQQEQQQRQEDMDTGDNNNNNNNEYNIAGLAAMGSDADGIDGNNNNNNNVGIIHDNSHKKLEPELPICSRHLSIQGTWLPAHPIDQQSWRKANYTWTPLGCRYEKSMTIETCLSGSSLSSSPKTKEKMKKILLQGDSHLRVLMEQLIRRMNGQDSIQGSTDAISSRILPTVVNERQELRFISDPLLRHLGDDANNNSNSKKNNDNEEEEDGEFDVLVTNVGHWATGVHYMDQLWSSEKYQGAIQEIVDQFTNQEEMEGEDEDLFSGEDIEEDEDEDDDDQVDNDDDEDGEEADEQVDEQDMMDERKVGKETDRHRDAYFEEDERDNDDEDDRQGNPEDDDQDDSQDDGEENKYTSKNYNRYKNKNNYSNNNNNNKPITTTTAAVSSTRQNQQTKSSSSSSYTRFGNNKTKYNKNTNNNKNNNNNNNNNKVAAATHRTKAAPARASTMYKDNMKNDYSRSSTKSPSSSSSTWGTKSRLSKQQQQRRPKQQPPPQQRQRHQKRQDQTPSTTTKKQQQQQQQKEPKQLIWVGMTAFPETQPTTESKYDKDWRSLYRLRYWNQMIEQVMMVNRIPFMDFYSMTLSMLDTSPNRNHYFGTDAGEAMLEELVFKLGLCTEEEDE